MDKHLTIEEKLNAEIELKENREKIKQLREEINKLKYRNQRLLYFLNNRKYHGGKHGGLCYAESDTYKKYGKKKNELTKEELKEYNRLKQREHRKKNSLQSNINKKEESR